MCSQYRISHFHFQVAEVLKGASVVIHTAAIIHGSHQSEMRMHAVNVTGTGNLISACIEYSVSKFVFTSTADVMLGWSDNYNLNESSLPGNDVSDFLFGQYAFTKMQAEKKVLEANGSALADGKSSLITCSLRMAVMYGEGDKLFIPNVINSAKSQFGFLPRMGNTDARFHTCYVGNAAWSRACS